METITCKCGHTGPLKAFTLSTPWGVFRCPSCKWRWMRCLDGRRVVLKDYVPTF